MARFRTPNFHNARFSVAQSLVRELVAKRTGAAASSGLFPVHPVVQAVSHVLKRVEACELTDAHAADRAYKHHRATQAAQGVSVTSVGGGTSLIGKIEAAIHTIEAVFETAETCADLAARYAIAWAMKDTAKMTEIKSEWEFSPCNLAGWFKAVEAYLAYYGDHSEPFYNPPLNAQGQGQAPFVTPGTFALPPAAQGGALRVGVLGDWGTGEQEAAAVLDQLMRHRPDVIVHVGDVYYAGTQDEQKTNFLDLINAARAQHGLNVPVYTLPGNHDYYCGGKPFFDMIPELNAGVPNASTQAHSFWALVNERWQLQGMDTGYHDSDLFTVSEDNTHLREDEAAWHLQQLGDHSGRTVILFSHHQLVSAFEQIGGAWTNPKLATNLAEWQEAGARIVAWLWGHEHVLEVYEPYRVSEDPRFGPVLGRCVGNGAFPVFTDSSDYAANPDGYKPLPAQSSPEGGITFPNDYVQSQADDLVWASGYAVLDLPGEGDATAWYYQVKFYGDVAAAQSELLWKDSIPS